MQGEREQALGFINNAFCKTRKSRKICEVLFDVAKWQRKRRCIERDSQGEQREKEKEWEKNTREEREQSVALWR